MTRLDAALAARGLARSRTHAATLISEGLVSVDGRPVVKASTAVNDAAEITIAGSDHYVGRAAHKLIAGLDGFGIPVDGLLALDMGASTGGFTQVLRERGARKVLAVDVGHGQLAPSIAADPGVVAVEGFNVRYMTRENLTEATGEAAAPELVVGDLSFISLELVLPAVAAVCAAESDILLLVKPQFEVGRTAVRGGLVTDPATRADAVARTVWSAWDVGLGMLGILPSPILGTHGNAEYLVHLAPGRGSNPTEWLDSINRLAGGR
ncbi:MULTISPECIES: TlyA family RNA methyltransferase [unclassified Microbacterium]|uniref:TlyA family RNA methyltransferase n=1 Tax=unclassified Microbacterium TaxID=2609290 RepID=UPI000CFDB70D|nr:MULTISPECIES: TlyA family RNA methyltransferase [unclassified Microbacterium]PQZ48770.1 TlyA family rRNA (cytidine-2'-O)-methyltransferase [Microbacterium sp. MYb43]PQZ72441.1 TlyA family rRNA (cytidine-2'-O)-methyltransferase [Microbacterium sp. MYb40]PRB14545.1 TlyA family rRNA (cytidine-2'-O)-methyltransferase [Microbacterium sp. MYb54]PRB21277.1 TlyA family rRNA (cytidine-2'-O)-methyltransferase [Microbacterium sp. MYb50]PRB66693.1 TlyA family rRNA (cytidine-2'-O)-methyltransferase [Mic